MRAGEAWLAALGCASISRTGALRACIPSRRCRGAVRELDSASEGGGSWFARPVGRWVVIGFLLQTWRGVLCSWFGHKQHGHVNRKGRFVKITCTRCRKELAR